MPGIVNPALEKEIADLVKKNFVDKLKLKNFYMLHGGIGTLTGGTVGAASGGVKEYIAQHNRKEDEPELTPEESQQKYTKAILTGGGIGAATGLLGGLMSGRGQMTKFRENQGDQLTKKTIDKINNAHAGAKAQFYGQEAARESITGALSTMHPTDQARLIAQIEKHPELGTAAMQAREKYIDNHDQFAKEQLGKIRPGIEALPPQEIDALHRLFNKDKTAEFRDKMHIAQIENNIRELNKTAEQVESPVSFSLERSSAKPGLPTKNEDNTLFRSLKATYGTSTVTRAHGLVNALDSRKKSNSNKALQALPKLAQEADRNVRYLEDLQGFPIEKVSHVLCLPDIVARLASMKEPTLGKQGAVKPPSSILAKLRKLWNPNYDNALFGEEVAAATRKKGLSTISPKSDTEDTSAFVRAARELRTGHGRNAKAYSDKMLTERASRKDIKGNKRVQKGMRDSGFVFNQDTVTPGQMKATFDGKPPAHTNTVSPAEKRLYKQVGDDKLLESKHFKELENTKTLADVLGSQQAHPAALDKAYPEGWVVKQRKGFGSLDSRVEDHPELFVRNKGNMSPERMAKLTQSMGHITPDSHADWVVQPDLDLAKANPLSRLADKFVPESVSKPFSGNKEYRVHTVNGKVIPFATMNRGGAVASAVEPYLPWRPRNLRKAEEHVQQILDGMKDSPLHKANHGFDVGIDKAGRPHMIESNIADGTGSVSGFIEKDPRVYDASVAAIKGELPRYVRNTRLGYAGAGALAVGGGGLALNSALNPSDTVKTAGAPPAPAIQLASNVPRPAATPKPTPAPKYPDGERIANRISVGDPEAWARVKQNWAGGARAGHFGPVDVVLRGTLSRSANNTIGEAIQKDDPKPLIDITKKFRDWAVPILQNNHIKGGLMEGVRNTVPTQVPATNQLPQSIKPLNAQQGLV